MLENWKNMEHKSDGDSSWNWRTRCSHQIFVQGLADLEIRGRAETIETTALVRSVRIQRKVLETWGDFLSLWFRWKNHQLTLVRKTVNELYIKINNNDNNMAKKRDNLVNSGHCRPDEPQMENQNKRMERQELGTCQRTKELWKMNVTVIPIIIGVLGMTLKSFIRRLEELEIKERAETIQTTALLRSAWILRTVHESWGD